MKKWLHSLIGKTLGYEPGDEGSTPSEATEYYGIFDNKKQERPEPFKFICYRLNSKMVFEDINIKLEQIQEAIKNSNL